MPSGDRHKHTGGNQTSHLFTPKSGIASVSQVPLQTAQSDCLAEGLFPTEKDNHAMYGKNITDIYPFI